MLSFVPIPISSPGPGYTAASPPRHSSKYNNQQDCEDPENYIDDNVDSKVRGMWFTEYGYIDIDTTSSSRAACDTFNRTLTRGYQAVWSYAKFGDAQMQCLILPPAPECIQAPWSRVNHLGNGRDGVPLNYTWRIPHFISNVQKLAVVRIRFVKKKVTIFLL